MGYNEYTCVLCGLREDENSFWIAGIDESVCEDCGERAMELRKPCSDKHSDPEGFGTKDCVDMYKCGVCKCWYCDACCEKNGGWCEECEHGKK